MVKANQLNGSGTITANGLTGTSAWATPSGGGGPRGAAGGGGGGGTCLLILENNESSVSISVSVGGRLTQHNGRRS